MIEFIIGRNLAKIAFGSILVLFSAFFLLNVSPVLAADCNPPPGGDYSTSSDGSCAFKGNVNGADNGNLTVSCGTTLTISNTQKIAWNPGRSIVICGSIVIVGGGQIKQAYLYAYDDDNDGHASGNPPNGKPQDISDSPSSPPQGDANYNRRYTMADLVVDCNDSLFSSANTCIPIVITSSATNQTSTSVGLNGWANPNGITATGYFRYWIAPQTVCDDSATSTGLRVPLTGGSSIPSANTFTQTATGSFDLTVSYWYCAIASNTLGKGYGSLHTFGAPTAPTVTTIDVISSNKTATSAFIGGIGNPNRSAATGYFMYWTSNPTGGCSDVTGIRVPSVGGTPLGSGETEQAFDELITGLTPGTNYWFCAQASNSAIPNIGYGTVKTFTTNSPSAPNVSTSSATSVTANSATLNGIANANGVSTHAWFRYSSSYPGSCDDSFGTRAPTSSASDTTSSSSPFGFSYSLLGLTPATTYYFCALANNAQGDASPFGDVMQFDTAASAPSATTISATATTNSTTLRGLVNPNGSTTMAWFNWSGSNTGCSSLSNQTNPSPIGSGTTNSNVNHQITGLSDGTTYYFCVVGSNSVGTDYGNVISFIPNQEGPNCVAPTETAGDGQTEASMNSTTLNGTINPNGCQSTWGFVYKKAPWTTSCDALFSGTGDGNILFGGVKGGNLVSPISKNIDGLASGTAYTFYAWGSNSGGTTCSESSAFVTQQPPPTDRCDPCEADSFCSPSTASSIQCPSNPNTCDFRGESCIYYHSPF